MGRSPWKDSVWRAQRLLIVLKLLSIKLSHEPHLSVPDTHMLMRNENTNLHMDLYTGMLGVSLVVQPLLGTDGDRQNSSPAHHDLCQHPPSSRSMNETRFVRKLWSRQIIWDTFQSHRSHTQRGTFSFAPLAWTFQKWNHWSGKQRGVAGAGEGWAGCREGWQRLGASSGAGKVDCSKWS